MTNKQYETWQASMRFFGKLFRCHQLPERSFHLRNMQFPLCARCTGILVGLVLVGPLLCIFLPVNMYVSLSLTLIMFIDGFTQLKGWRESNNYLRLITGIGFGYSVVSFLAHIIQRIISLI